MLQLLESNRELYDAENPDAGYLNWITHYQFLGTFPLRETVVVHCSWRVSRTAVCSRSDPAADLDSGLGLVELKGCEPSTPFRHTSLPLVSRETRAG